MFRRALILSMLCSALREADAPRKGLSSPCSTVNTNLTSRPNDADPWAIKEGRFHERHTCSSVFSRRDLPARATLEHLGNEAKAHLRALRKEKPATSLSKAQLDVARSYGFSSWRTLKTYVDALHSFGAQIIQAVREGDLPTIRRILDRYPELVNASTDLQQRVRPSDTFAMRLTHLAIAENGGPLTLRTRS